MDYLLDPKPYKSGLLDRDNKRSTASNRSSIRRGIWDLGGLEFWFWGGGGEGSGGYVQPKPIFPWSNLEHLKQMLARSPPWCKFMNINTPISAELAGLAAFTSFQLLDTLNMDRGYKRVDVVVSER